MTTATKTRDKELQRCMAAGKRAGAPMDQVRLLVDLAGYIPFPWQWKFHAAARECDEQDGPTQIGLGGARGPGKSHAVLSEAALDDCQRMDGLKVLFLRQTGVSAQESFDDLIDRAVRGRVEFHKRKNFLRFPNGSRILLGGYKNENDIDKYIGIEYDVIIIEELTQLTEAKYDKVRGSLRTSKDGWRPRIYASFNPGGIGHGWVKDRFVIPYREKRQEVTRFIPSTYKENPALDVSYITYLESLGGDLGKAWREGDWDLFAGQYFSEWRYEIHTCEPFEIPVTWPRFRSIDPSGREGITSCHWYALDQNGRVWVYREYYYGPGVRDKDGQIIITGRDYDEHAKEIYRLSCDEHGVSEKYQYTIIDTAAFAKAGFSETAAEIYERHGVTDLLPSAKERVIGWNAVHTYLRWTAPSEKSNPQKALLQVFRTCVNMIRTIPLLQHDERHPEDVDTRNEDHAADELRYLLRTIREKKAPKGMNVVERKLKAFRDRNRGTGQDYSYQRH